MSTINLSEHFTYRKLLWFVLPSIFIFLIDITYEMIDGFFVYKLAGNDAFDSINIITPILVSIGTLGFMFGTGGSALISAVLGKNKKEFVKKIFTMIVSSIIIVGIILSFLAFIYMEKIVKFLGVNENLIDGCVKYGKILVCFIPFFVLQNAFSSLLITAGKRGYGLIFIIITAILNIILDIILIYKMELGLIGAAIATGSSYFIGGLMPLIYFSTGKNKILCFTKTKINSKILKKVCSNGFSEMISNISIAAVSIVYNFQLIKLIGSVTPYSIIKYLNFVFLAIFLGFSSGSINIISYKYGKEDKEGLKNIFKKSIILILIIGCSMVVLTNIYAYKLAFIFTGNNENLYQLTVYAIKTYSISFVICGFNIFGSAYFTGLNDEKTSTLISVLRTFVLQIPLIFILPSIFGKDSIWLSTIVAEGITFIITIFLFFKFNNKEFEKDKIAVIKTLGSEIKEKIDIKKDFNKINEKNKIIKETIDKINNSDIKINKENDNKSENKTEEENDNKNNVTDNNTSNS